MNWIDNIDWGGVVVCIVIAILLPFVVKRILKVAKEREERYND